MAGFGGGGNRREKRMVLSKEFRGAQAAGTGHLFLEGLKAGKNHQGATWGPMGAGKGKRKEKTRMPRNDWEEGVHG